MKFFYAIILSFPFLLNAQDVHFSQWHNNPLFLTPSSAGYFDGLYRITAQQREQWASVSIPFSTTSIGIDMPLKKWGVGAQLVRDQSGSSHLSLLQLSLSLSRSLSDWRVGFQIGMARQQIDYSELIFIDNGEQIPSANNSFLDFSAGIHKTFWIGEMSIDGGYAFFHINTPNRSFHSYEDLLPVKHQWYSLLHYPLSSQWSVQPSIQWLKQEKQSQLVLGSQIEYDMSQTNYQDIGLQGGAYFRLGDALNVLLGLQWEQSQLAFSYDVNISDLVPASNSRGAWEISFIHIIKSSINRPSNKMCPSFL